MKLIKNDNCKIFSQLSKAQSGFSEVTKAKEAKGGVSKNGKTFGGYKYADLTQVLNAITPSLNANGIFLFQSPTIEAGKFSLVTAIGNEDGDVLELGSINDFPIAGLTPQELGALITYLRRYSLLSCFGLGTEDDDASDISRKLEAEAIKQQKLADENAKKTALNQAKAPSVNPISQPQTSKNEASEEEVQFIYAAIEGCHFIPELTAIGKDLIAPLPVKQQEEIRPAYIKRMNVLKASVNQTSSVDGLSANSISA